MKFIPESEIKKSEESLNWKGKAANTGPKGVIKDWQRFKQLENEKTAETDAEKARLIKKLAMTCKSADLDELAEKHNLPKPEQQAQAEADDDLMDDEFFQEYIKKKFMEMNKKLNDL